MSPQPLRPVTTLLVATFVVVVAGLVLHANVGQSLYRVVPRLVGRRDVDRDQPADAAKQYALYHYDPPTTYAGSPFDSPSDIERLWFPKYAKLEHSVFADLARCEQLTELHVESGVIDDGSFPEIGQIHSLNHLYLNGSHGFSPDSLAFLDWLPDLQTLCLSHCQLTDDHLRPIGELRFVRVLDLSSTMITDSGLRHLDDMQYLEVLDIGDTNVTAFGLNELRNLRSLRAVHADRIEIKYLHDRLRHKVWNRELSSTLLPIDEPQDTKRSL